MSPLAQMTDAQLATEQKKNTRERRKAAQGFKSRGLELQAEMDRRAAKARLAKALEGVDAATAKALIDELQAGSED